MITINALNATLSECASSVSASVGSAFLRSEYALFLAWLSRSGSSEDTRVIPRFHAPGFVTNDRRMGDGREEDSTSTEDVEPKYATSATLNPLEAAEYLMEETVASMVKERYETVKPSVDSSTGEVHVEGDPTVALTETIHQLTYEPHVLLQKLVLDHGLVLWYGQFVRLNIFHLCISRYENGGTFVPP